MSKELRAGGLPPPTILSYAQIRGGVNGDLYHPLGRPSESIAEWAKRNNVKMVSAGSMAKLFEDLARIMEEEGPYEPGKSKILVDSAFITLYTNKR